MQLREQRTDWTEPGAHVVVPGVYRIPLPVEIDGLHAVNVYAIVDGDDLTLVDSGWADPGSRSALDTGLGALGAAAGDVTRFVVTHAHWDHYTQAVSLRGEFGTRVLLGARERPTLERFDLADGAYPEQVRRLRRCGAPDLALEVAQVPVTDDDRAVDFGAPDVWLEDGDKLDTPTRTLEVIATPGHTRGHIVVRDADAGLLFSGDHVLPHITPSLGLERAPEPAPLRSYLQSLELVRAQPDLLLLPAHGAVSPSTHVRIDELLAHHEQRLALVARLVGDGHGTAFEVAGAMRWTRRGRALAELGVTHRMTAVLEVQAHLDVLAEAGEVVAVDDPSTWRYTAR